MPMARYAVPEPRHPYNGATPVVPAATPKKKGVFVDALSLNF